MKKQKHFIKIVLLITMLFQVIGMDFRVIKAAGISVYASQSTASPNSTVTVTASGLTNIRGRFDVSVRNGSASPSSFFANGSGSYSVRVSVGSSGSTGVTISPTDAATIDGDPVSGGITTIQIKSSSGGSSSGGYSSGGSSSTTNQPKKDEVKKNSDSSLKSLSVSQGTLSPSFQKGTTSYKLDLPGTATSIKINAAANDAKASVSGTGEKKLNPGDNKLQVNCTAENGTTTVYTIQVHVDEKPLVYVNLNDKKLGVSRASVEMNKKLFTETKIKIDGTEVPAWTNKSLNMMLLYLENGNKKDFYFYDTEKKEVTSIYRPMGLLGENIAMIDVPKELQARVGMTFTTVKVDGKEFPGWTFQDKAFENYALIYVMNDAGDTVYYQYEKTGNTLQKFSGSAAITQKNYEQLIKDQDKETNQLTLFLCILGGTSVLLLIALIVVAMRKKKTKRFQKVAIDGSGLSKGAQSEHESILKMKEEEGED